MQELLHERTSRLLLHFGRFCGSNESGPVVGQEGGG